MRLTDAQRELVEAARELGGPRDFTRMGWDLYELALHNKDVRDAAVRFDQWLEDERWRREHPDLVVNPANLRVD